MPRVMFDVAFNLFLEQLDFLETLDFDFDLTLDIYPKDSGKSCCLNFHDQ